MKEGVARSHEGLFGNRFQKDDILKIKRFSMKKMLYEIFSMYIT